jgi:hypothetical protein
MPSAGTFWNNHNRQDKSSHVQFQCLHSTWSRVAGLALCDLQRVFQFDPSVIRNANYQKFGEIMESLQSGRLHPDDQGRIAHMTSLIGRYNQWQGEYTAALSDHGLLWQRQQDDQLKEALSLLQFYGLVENGRSDIRKLLAATCGAVLNPFTLGRERARLETDSALRIAVGLHNASPSSIQRAAANDLAGKILSAYGQLRDIVLGKDLNVE